jgi:hypothetical protein
MREPASGEKDKPASFFLSNGFGKTEKAQTA